MGVLGPMMNAMEDKGWEVNPYFPGSPGEDPKQYFSTLGEFLRLAGTYDALLLDQASFCRWGKKVEPLFDEYVLALAKSKYQGQVVVTTAQTEDEFRESVPKEIGERVKVLEKEFSGPTIIIQAIEEAQRRA